MKSRPLTRIRTGMSKDCRSDGRRRVDIVLGHRVIVFEDMRADAIDQRRMQRIHSFRPGQKAGRGLPEIRLESLERSLDCRLLASSNRTADVIEQSAARLMPHIFGNILQATVTRYVARALVSDNTFLPRLRSVCAAKLFTVADFRSKYYRFFCQVDMTEPSFIYRPLADPRTFRFAKEEPWIKRYLKRASAFAARCLAPSLWTMPSRRPTISTARCRNWSPSIAGAKSGVVPGLDRKTRSMLNLAMLSALNRPHEIKLHVRGALTNGVTKDEIKEVFLQVAIYCGVPAGVDSFRIAREVFKEMGV